MSLPFFDKSLLTAELPELLVPQYFPSSFTLGRVTATTLELMFADVFIRFNGHVALSGWIKCTSLWDMKNSLLEKREKKTRNSL